MGRSGTHRPNQIPKDIVVVEARVKDEDALEQHLGRLVMKVHDQNLRRSPSTTLTPGATPVVGEDQRAAAVRTASFDPELRRPIREEDEEAEEALDPQEAETLRRADERFQLWRMFENRRHPTLKGSLAPPLAVETLRFHVQRPPPPLPRLTRSFTSV